MIDVVIQKRTPVWRRACTACHTTFANTKLYGLRPENLSRSSTSRASQMHRMESKSPIHRQQHTTMKKPTFAFS